MLPVLIVIGFVVVIGAYAFFEWQESQEEKKLVQEVEELKKKPSIWGYTNNRVLHSQKQKLIQNWFVDVTYTELEVKDIDDGKDDYLDLEVSDQEPLKLGGVLVDDNGEIINAVDLVKTRVDQPMVSNE